MWPTTVPVHRSGESPLTLVLTAAALNVIRLDDWWAGAPVSRTRCARFAALQVPA
jgi:hypothetical protein